VPRSIKEWIGANDDTPIPPRVKQRVVARANQCCANCGLRIGYGGEIDHVVALKNWNPTPEAPHGNRESNLRFTCGPCHAIKSRDDVAEKSKIYQIQKRMGPLKRERSEWSKKLEGYRYNWQRGRYEREP